MPFLSYTLFTDRDCKTVLSVANLEGDLAIRIRRAITTCNHGRPIREGETYPDLGIRIDRLESEDLASQEG